MPDRLLDNPDEVREGDEPETPPAADRTFAAQPILIEPLSDDAQDRRRLLSMQTWALMILASGAVLSLIYVAKLILVVVLLSILISFVLAPLVDLMTHFDIPRAFGALVAVLLLVIALGSVTYVSYSRALSFMQELPKYKAHIQQLGAKLREQAEQIQQTTETVLPDSEEDKKTVTVKESSSWTNVLSRNASSVSELGLAITFIPFLVFFMLSWQDHVRSASVMLFRMENRNTAYTMLGLIARMIRSFIVGNFIIGVFLSLCSMAVFALLGLKYFYFLGLISGFLSLIPYLGVILGMAPPLVAGLEHLTTGSAVLIIASVLGLHLIAMNVLYPKILGKRLQLNPLALTLALLFWGWLWGAMGLILAVPITGACKIICDHIERLKPYGAWMGE